MKTLGLDIGGVNIKAAHSDSAAWTVPFVLCDQPNRLAEPLDGVARQSPAYDRVAVTMTGELCGCFESKRRGVEHILDAVEGVFNNRRIAVWTTAGRFVGASEARQEPLGCAGANWHALATYTARQFPNGGTLLVDTGSTTTDIIRLHAEVPVPTGLTDMDRLASGELAYVGAQHTPLAAVAQEIYWKGKPTSLMAETFATTRDVFLLTGQAEDAPDRCDTADSRPMTRKHAAVRLARMIGADMEMLTEADVARLAQSFAQAVHELVARSIKKVTRRAKIDRVVISGSGGFIASAAASIALPKVHQTLLGSMIDAQASVAACAFALVVLSKDRLNDI